MTSFSMWNKKTKETIRYILRKIYQHNDDQYEINTDNDKVHIEHIMPESISQWNQSNGRQKIDLITDEVHKSYLWRLGNLTLLSGKINKKASNKTFDAKRKDYEKSKLEHNKKNAENTEWGPVQIEARQKQLAEYAVKIWPKIENKDDKR